MRLKTQDLSTHLQRGLAPLYFIVGEEPQQQLEALNKIRLKAQHEGYTDRERYDISPQFDWESFKTELQALTLFSKKRFIEARLTGNIGKLGARVLVEIASHPTPDTLLLFSADKLDSAVAKSAWFTAIERLGVTLWARPLLGSELKAWITNRIKQVGVNLDEEAMHTLIERTEGNLTATAQAIEKLSLYSSSLEAITLNGRAVAEITSVDTHFSLFDLVDTALLGNILRTKQIFARLKSEGVEPILILWAITREVRAILPLAQAMNKGLSLTEAVAQQNLWKHKLPIYTSFLKRSSLHTIHQLLIQAKDLDALIKGRKIGDIWSSLFLVCLNLAGVNYATTL
jgi:DNA polymerase-3 subunit delta